MTTIKTEQSREVVRVSKATHKLLHGYGTKKGLTVGEAADALITTAIGRLTALAKYNETPKGQRGRKKSLATKKAARKPAKKTAKKPAKKTAKRAA